MVADRPGLPSASCPRPVEGRRPSPELELTVVALEDGRSVLGVGLRPGVLDAQPDELTDITYAGSWRRYRGLPQPQN